MKPTNEKVGIELRHMVTGNMITWYFSDHSVPAQSYINNRVQKLVDKHQRLIEEHDLPTKENGTINFDEVPNDQDDLIVEISEINQKILKLQMDGICCILEPKEDLPEGYNNKRELLEECIGSFEVIPVIKNFFSQHSGSSIASRVDGTPLVLFKKPNGETINPMKELEEARQKQEAKAKAEETSSESKSSSTD